MADSGAVRARRYRLHRQNDHSLCKDGCDRPKLTIIEGQADRDELASVVAAEFAHADPLVAALAARLAGLATGSGPAAVNAVKALAELTAAQRAEHPGRPVSRIRGVS